MISVAALEPAHAQSLATAANFPAVASALRNAFPSPYTIEDADWFISFAADNTANNIIKGIFVNNVCEGVCSLDQSRVDPFVWELGYWLRPALSGQGIATSAVKLLIEQVLSSSVAPQITRIEAKVLAGNVASQRVLAKNGFSHEGLMKNYSNHKDCHLYAFPLATFRRAATASSLRGNFIHCKARGEVQMLMDHVLSIDSDGVIVSLEEADGDCELEKQSALSFVTPGFIDTHIHAPQYSYAGTATDRPLMGAEGWLESYTFPAESRLSGNVALTEEVYSKVVERTLRNGTTTALYFGTIDVGATKQLADICAAKGQRAMIGKVAMDRNAPDSYVETTAEGLRGTRAFIEYVLGLGLGLMLMPVVTPRFIPTCSPELLKGLGELAAEYDCFVQSHCSESVDEVAFTQALHPGEGSDTDIFKKHGLMRKGCMAHCVFCDDDDLEQFRKAKMGVAHCALSNFYFAGGTFDARKAANAGVDVGLGTDVAGGYSPSMLNSMRTSVINSRNEVNWKESLFLATQGGADALGLGDVVGSFEVGKRFDAVEFNAEGGDCFDVFKTDTAEDVFQKIMTNGDDRLISKVWVNGQRRV